MTIDEENGGNNDMHVIVKVLTMESKTEEVAPDVEVLTTMESKTEEEAPPDVPHAAEKTAPVTPPLVASFHDSWTPAAARFPNDDSEMYPFLDSKVTMRKIKGYVNDENLMPMTTYSFIVSTTFDKTNFINFFVLTLQIASYIAVIASSFDFGDEGNPFRFPANVTSAVRATQILSLIYSICVQDSIIKALYTFRNGYDEVELRRSFPDCTESSTGLKVRWYLSLSLILSLGLLAQWLTFLLIMQSSDTLGVLLNYAAVNFISTIDDRMFYLGKRGWFGRFIEKEVRAICLADDPVPNPRWPWYRRQAHTISLLLIFGALIICWMLVVNAQSSGIYLSKTILVQFGDYVHPSLGTFSGLYDINYQRFKVFSADRSVYTERLSKRAHFGYCKSAGAWTFGYNVSESEFDACSWAAMSSPTESFDILTTVFSQWTAKNPDGKPVPMDRASIFSFDCTRHSNPCGLYGTCSHSRNECICDSGWFGLKCDSLAPCPLLQLDARYGNTFGSAERSWSSKYEILKFGNDTALVYEHPVYVTQTNPPGQVADGSLNTFDILFFTGRRWAQAFSGEFYSPARDGDLETYLKSFHAEFSDYTVAFLSESITPILDSPSPIGVGWFFADQEVDTSMQAANGQALDMGFLCATCDDNKHTCFYDGICGSDGICQCSQGSEGSLCEQPPIGNGRCDVFYNKLQFEMDGGDCCRATCVSSNDYICGKDETGYLDYGFFNCATNDPLPSEILTGEPFSETGGLISISENGYLLAATAAKGKNVVIYDKAGHKWSKRFVLNVCGTAVRAMDMSGGPFVSNPVVKATPFILVVSCLGSTEPSLYYCREEHASRCTPNRLELPQDVDVSFGFSVSISSDGGVVAVASSQEGLTGSGFVSISRARQGANARTIQWSGGANETIVPTKYFGTEITPDDQGMVLPMPPVWNSSLSPSWNSSLPPFLNSTVSPSRNISENVAHHLHSSNRSLMAPVALGITNSTLSATAGPTTTPTPTISTAPTNIPSMSPTAIPTSAPTATAQHILAASLSGNGNALAIAAADTFDSLSVQIHYYQYNGTVWEEQGVPLEETLCSTRGKFFAVQDMIQLSEDGQTLLVSGGSNMSIFGWENESDKWVLRGDPIHPEKECSVKTLSLSPSGNVIAADLITSDEDEVSGSSVWSFGWEGSGWQRREQEGLGVAKLSVDVVARLALDYGGRELAIGAARFTADRSGTVATFEYPRTNCAEGFHLYRTTMVIQPKVTRWTLSSVSHHDTLTLLEGGPYLFPNFDGAGEVASARHDMATVVDEQCMPISKCGVYTLYPTNFGGSAIITDGEVVYKEDQNNEIFRTFVGNMSDTEWCHQFWQHELTPSPPS